MTQHRFLLCLMALLTTSEQIVGQESLMSNSSSSNIATLPKADDSNKIRLSLESKVETELLAVAKEHSPTQQNIAALIRGKKGHPVKKKVIKRLFLLRKQITLFQNKERLTSQEKEILRRKKEELIEKQESLLRNVIRDSRSIEDQPFLLTGLLQLLKLNKMPYATKKNPKDLLKNFLKQSSYPLSSSLMSFLLHEPIYYCLYSLQPKKGKGKQLEQVFQEQYDQKALYKEKDCIPSPQYYYEEAAYNQVGHALWEQYLSSAPFGMTKSILDEGMEWNSYMGNTGCLLVWTILPLCDVYSGTSSVAYIHKKIKNIKKELKKFFFQNSQKFFPSFYAYGCKFYEEINNPIIYFPKKISLGDGGKMISNMVYDRFLVGTIKELLFQIFPSIESLGVSYLNNFPFILQHEKIISNWGKEEIKKKINTCLTVLYWQKISVISLFIGLILYLLPPSLNFSKQLTSQKKKISLTEFKLWDYFKKIEDPMLFISVLGFIISLVTWLISIYYPRLDYALADMAGLLGYEKEEKTSNRYENAAKIIVTLSKWLNHSGFISGHKGEQYNIVHYQLMMKMIEEKCIEFTEQYAHHITFTKLIRLISVGIIVVSFLSLFYSFIKHPAKNNNHFLLQNNNSEESNEMLQQRKPPKGILSYLISQYKALKSVSKTIKWEKKCYWTMITLCILFFLYLLEKIICKVSLMEQLLCALFPIHQEWFTVSLLLSCLFFIFIYGVRSQVKELRDNMSFIYRVHKEIFSITEVILLLEVRGVGIWIMLILLDRLITGPSCVGSNWVYERLIAALQSLERSIALLWQKLPAVLRWSLIIVLFFCILWMASSYYILQKDSYIYIDHSLPLFKIRKKIWVNLLLLLIYILCEFVWYVHSDGYAKDVIDYSSFWSGFYFPIHSFYRASGWSYNSFIALMHYCRIRKVVAILGALCLVTLCLILNNLTEKKNNLIKISNIEYITCYMEIQLSNHVLQRQNKDYQLSVVYKTMESNYFWLTWLYPIIFLLESCVWKYLHAKINQWYVSSRVEPHLPSCDEPYLMQIIQSDCPASEKIERTKQLLQAGVDPQAAYLSVTLKKVTEKTPWINRAVEKEGDKKDIKKKATDRQQKQKWGAELDKIGGHDMQLFYEIISPYAYVREKVHQEKYNTFWQQLLDCYQQHAPSLKDKPSVIIVRAHDYLKDNAAQLKKIKKLWSEGENIKNAQKKLVNNFNKGKGYLSSEAYQEEYTRLHDEYYENSKAINKEVDIDSIYRIKEFHRLRLNYLRYPQEQEDSIKKKFGIERVVYHK